MKYIEAEEIDKINCYPALIEALNKGFQSDIVVPSRQHYNYASSSNTKDSTLLIMPAWQNKGRIGVKIVSVSPENEKLELPAIHGWYMLMNAVTGKPIMHMDARMLTVLRTACASALASQFLSRKDSRTLFMLGSGALAPHLIQAHCQVRPIKKVYVWSRSTKNAAALCQSLQLKGIEVERINSIEEGVRKADIISCATLSETPLLEGHFIKEGQHIDLVGSYQTHTREADDELIKRSKVYVDSFQGMLESGDIAIPINTNVIEEKDIIGDLFSLCKEEVKGRAGESEITVFKSVGHALEDLVAANYFYDNH